MSRTSIHRSVCITLLGALIGGCGLFSQQQEPATSNKGVPCDGSFEADFYGCDPNATQRDCAAINDAMVSDPKQCCYGAYQDPDSQWRCKGLSESKRAE